MTIALFQQDAYQNTCDAEVRAINDRGGIILNQTIFYPTGGGQPGDSGTLTFGNSQIKIATTVKDRESGEIVHVPEAGQSLPEVGQMVKAEIDWDTRYLHMRMHTALHLLCSVVPCGVTGGQIGKEKSRLDFDVGEKPLDKDQITEDLNRIIAEKQKVEFRWITDEELENQPELVRTMSVQPPKGAGKVRLVKIGENIDLQPCGGTHVNNIEEIGVIKVSKIENKGKRNRRVNIVFG
ncbi:alanyl-tRNA editing protein [Aliikangiella sp. G2MR2-5]|uniref:alanyl-tRNA editing protein n=1 Tax=Aliikangiella sp. G2MR2-5 TaxID=2788943 RepID=UPI0018A9A4AF|nr:alanyl-tRNA editing protein [Aliikangiella sp. G2MR2-5]